MEREESILECQLSSNCRIWHLKMVTMMLVLPPNNWPEVIEATSHVTGKTKLVEKGLSLLMTKLSALPILETSLKKPFFSKHSVMDEGNSAFNCAHSSAELYYVSTYLHSLKGLCFSAAWPLRLSQLSMCARTLTFCSQLWDFISNMRIFFRALECMLLAYVYTVHISVLMTLAGAWY